MKTLTEITDPASAGTADGTASRFFLAFIRDSRDLPFVRLSLAITFTLIPLAVLLYVPHIPGWLWWLAAVAYLYLNNVVFKGPFGLMMHCTSHRAFFKKEYAVFNHYHPWVLGPLFGQTPETYFSHHIGMHHPENNMPDDESSTMKYQRDSLAGFLHYLATFFFAGIYHLASYFVRKKRKRLLYRSVRGELLFFLFCAALCVVNWPATVVVFILPFVISRIIMMMGNWAQHAFIDAADPENPYKNSVTCINTKYNHKCWNDGYHISHHVKPGMHWTEHPEHFKRSLHLYAANDAIVFDGIHFLHVFVYLMRNRYDLLARHFVNIGHRYTTDDEVIALLRSRTARIDVAPYLLALAAGNIRTATDDR